MPGRMSRYTAPVTSLSWNWIGLEVTLTPLVAVLLAWPFWRKNEIIFGNVVATALIFGAGFGLIWREYIVIDRVTKACLEAGSVCFPDPSAFTRFAIYGFVALVEVFAVFSFSLWVEEHRRSRDYDPEWR